MRAIAEGLVSGVAAAAEANGRSSGEAEELPVRIHNFEVTFHSDRPIVIDRDFRRRHFFS
jgi:hypothetical protein